MFCHLSEVHCLLLPSDFGPSSDLVTIINLLAVYGSSDPLVVSFLSAFRVPTSDFRPMGEKPPFDLVLSDFFEGDQAVHGRMSARKSTVDILVPLKHGNGSLCVSVTQRMNL
jgi:hypothetical protein